MMNPRQKLEGVGVGLGKAGKLVCIPGPGQCYLRCVYGPHLQEELLDLALHSFPPMAPPAREAQGHASRSVMQSLADLLYHLGPLCARGNLAPCPEPSIRALPLLAGALSRPHKIWVLVKSARTSLSEATLRSRDEDAFMFPL